MPDPAPVTSATLPNAVICHTSCFRIYRKGDSILKEPIGVAIGIGIGIEIHFNIGWLDPDSDPDPEKEAPGSTKAKISCVV
jgi:hypothetical protein